MKRNTKRHTNMPYRYKLMTDRLYFMHTDINRHALQHTQPKRHTNMPHISLSIYVL
jgi:hypothetical protein